LGGKSEKGHKEEERKDIEKFEVDKAKGGEVME
jgi:hypothetical protein